jgi:hypothetical protein
MTVEGTFEKSEVRTDDKYKKIICRIDDGTCYDNAFK